MAAPGGGQRWSGGRLALGVVAFAVFAWPNFTLLGLPLAGLLLAAGPESRREWAALAAAALVGATGLALVGGGGLLATAIVAYAPLVTVAFVAVAATRPGPFLGMAARAMLWAAAGLLVLLQTTLGGLALRALRMEAFHAAVAALRPALTWQPDAAPLFEPMVGFLSATIPAQLALQTLAGLALAWQLHGRIARRPLGRPLAPFREFRFGDQWVWGVIGAIAVWVVPALAGLKTVALNVTVVLGALYLLRGAAVVAAFAAATGVSIATLVGGAVVGVVLVLPMVLLVPGLWTLGVSDIWLQFRRRLASRPTHT